MIYAIISLVVFKMLHEIPEKFGSILRPFKMLRSIIVIKRVYNINNTIVLFISLE